MISSIAVQLFGLTKTYRPRNRDPIVAVQDLNLSIPVGQIFGFLGPNGAGKTTTIKMMCALVKPSDGRVEINGYDTWRQRSQSMRQIGAVLEGTRNIHWALSAWDNLVYFGNLKGLHGRSLKNRAESLLRDLDLWERRRDLVRTFSRGMQQKVAISCALIADPPVLLLDEPTLGLDVRSARTVKDLVRKLATDFGKTIVLTTHQLDMAQELCDHLAVISRGRIIANQRVDELIDLFREEYYQIKVRGQLPFPEDPLLSGLNIVEGDEITILSGAIQNQHALYAILDGIHAWDLPLVSASLVEPDLEDIFVRLLDNDLNAGEVAK
jgi:ABC-2 type transport system ATP-binding protein